MYKYKRLFAILAMIIAISFIFTACNYKSIDDDDEDSTKSKEKNTATGEVSATEESTGRTDGFGSKNCKEHTWVDATCKAPKTCSNCGKTEGKKGDHNYLQSIENAATCLKSGTKKFICEYCDDYYTEEYSSRKYDSTSIYEMYEKSVGEVTTYDKNGNGLALGTCFVYSSDGMVITNYHVIDGAYSAKVTIGTKTYSVTEVLAYDIDIDIAVLRVNGKNLRKANICTETHKSGAKVYALGSSQGLTLTFSQGMITHSSREIDGVVYVQHDASISSGNSGGPLINEYGEVIGINTWTLLESQNLNFAINVSELKNLDYSNPMTMPEVYEKERDIFNSIFYHVINQGEYDETDNIYMLYIDDYKDDYDREHIMFIYYDVNSDCLVLGYYYEDYANTSNEYWFGIEIDPELSGRYLWMYEEKNYEMYGYFDASTYTKDTVLDYTSTNTASTITQNTLRKRAGSMFNKLLNSFMSNVAENMDVELSDLGFYSFE